MEHAKQVEILKELMRQLDCGETHDAGAQYRMPTSDYVCPELARQEWDEIFHSRPQLIGLSGDLPEEGSYFTMDDLGTPIVASRDRNGTFHAFVNACRHRGARVTTQERGKAPMFVCPFHAWSYSTDGKLVGIPESEQFGAIDKSCHGLIALPAQEYHGMLWIHPKPDGELDASTLLGPFAEEILGYEFGAMKRTDDTTIAMNLNWKLANDTFGETYHFGKLHSDTLGQSFYGCNQHYVEFGHHHRFVTAGRAIDRLRELPESEWTLTPHALMVYYLFPNIQLILGEDRVTLVRIYPDPKDPGRSISRISAYYKQHVLDAVETVAPELRIGPDNIYQVRPPGAVVTPEAVFEVFASTIEAEDYLMGEQQQKTAQSGLIKESLFGRNEAALHHFHNSYREVLGRPALERVE